MEANIIDKKQKKELHAFHVGDIVKVKSIEEIEEGLDPSMKLDGCLFASEMKKWSGREARIIKIMKNYFDEHSMKMLKVKASLYILEGTICSGEVNSFQARCDHSCHFIWHEKWLENVKGKVRDA